jgi:hypothetical protein
MHGLYLCARVGSCHSHVAPQSFSSFCVVVWPTVRQADPHAPHETLRYGYGSAFVAETLLCAVTTFVHLVAHYKARVDGSPAYGVAVGGVTLATVQCLVGDGTRGAHVVQGPVSVGTCPC